MSHTNQFAISPIAAAVSAALATPAAVLAQEEPAGDVLEEIIVTATKREQNLQKIPASVQALPEAMLKEMGALNTEDYVRFMPQVNWINFNSGQNAIIFRGVNTTTSGYTGTQASSVYLDEIPITATDGSSPDIRMLDVTRTEALSGPQGTLYGAAAQAGTLRIITNKPDTSQFEASVEVMARNGETSDRSHNITGVFNIPLVEDVFAVRMAVLSATDGGYIDNVSGRTPDRWFGETAAENAAGGTAAPKSWGANRLEWGSYRNDNVVEQNWNSAEYTLLRLSARWDINDAWSVTAAYHYGDTDSQGNTGYNPFVGDLEIVAFAKNQSRSEWDMSSLVIEADLGFAQLVSATSFYENQRTYRIDNTLYYRYYMTNNYCRDDGVWDDLTGPGYYDPNNTYYAYWKWNNPDSGRAIYNPLYCAAFPNVNPTGAIDQLPDYVGIGEGPEWQERFTQELRLSHQGETFDWLAGLYYEDSNDSWNSVWFGDANTPYRDSMSFAFISDCAEDGAADPNGNMHWSCNPASNNGVLWDGADVVIEALETADHYWDSRDDTDWETKAVFGEVTWHATDKTNVTIGGRWFETVNDKVYRKFIAGSTAPNGRHIGGFAQGAWRGNDTPQNATLSEFVPKVGVDYNISDDKMLYGLYSEGYRVGGINRANKNADWDRTLWGQEWEPDKLKNYEIGWKSRLAGNTVQLNLTGFYMKWEDFQHEVVDPSVGVCVFPAEEPSCKPPPPSTRPDGSTDSQALPWISIVGNVGDAHIAGVVAELDWVPADGWRIGANVQFLEAEIDSVTSSDEAGLEKGQELPNVPELQGSLWATYSWPVQFVPGAEMFLRGQYSFTGETQTLLIPEAETEINPSFTNDSYGIGDLRFGLVSPDGGWQIDLFVSNVTDERAQIQQGGTNAWNWGSTGEYDRAHTVYTVRPREYGLRFASRWGD